MRQILAWVSWSKAAVILGLLSLVVGAVGQVGSDPGDRAGAYPKLRGVYEEYGIALTKDGAFQASERARWLSATLEMSPTFRAVLGYFDLAQFSAKMLDENYIELGDAQTIRAGRFRARYGITSWADEWYSGFIFPPLVHNSPSYSTTRLSRFDTGVAVHGGSPNAEYDLSWVDTSSTPFQLTPTRMDHVVARLQTYRYGIVWGANAMFGPRGLGDGEKAFGLDLRWTWPQWEVWAEQDWVHSLAEDSSGYFVDVFYNPFSLPRTTFLLRTQSMQASGAYPDRWNLVTLGVKQVLGPMIAAHLNYTFGPDSERIQPGDGWAVQMLATFKF